jgi:hypothetical protein
MIGRVAIVLDFLRRVRSQIALPATEHGPVAGRDEEVTISQAVCDLRQQILNALEQTEDDGRIIFKTEAAELEFTVVYGRKLQGGTEASAWSVVTGSNLAKSNNQNTHKVKLLLKIIDVMAPAATGQQISLNLNKENQMQSEEDKKLERPLNKYLSQYVADYETQRLTADIKTNVTKVVDNIRARGALEDPKFIEELETLRMQANALADKLVPSGNLFNRKDELLQVVNDGVQDLLALYDKNSPADHNVQADFKQPRPPGSSIEKYWLLRRWRR